MVPQSEIRARILDAALAHAHAHGGLLFEPESPRIRTARLTYATPDAGRNEWSTGLSTESLFARWLRVNGTVLPLPESTGLWGSLPDSCRDRLALQSVRACIPLVLEMNLVGWVFVLGGDPWQPSDPRIGLIENDQPAWAGALGAMQLEQEVVARAAVVSRSNRLNLAGHLAVSAAHEIRNSLAAVRSIVQLVLSKDAAASEHDHLLTTVLTEVDRVNAALSRTLTVGRTGEATRTSVRVSALMTEAASFCRAYALRRGQTITLSGASPAVVWGDPNELRQVLVNVLLNACQASADGAEIGIEQLVAAPDRVAIVVRDQGAGMTPDLMARAFEPFYSTKQDGGGLGLAISRDIVYRHGGEIVLQSAAGTGTTVTLRLPLGDPCGPHTGG